MLGRFGGLRLLVDFYTSLQLCGALFEGGVVVHRLRCLFLIVKRGIVETFVIFIGIRVLHLFISSSIHIFISSSLHLRALHLAFICLVLWRSLFDLFVYVPIFVCWVCRRNLWTKVDFVGILSILAV